MKTESVTPVKPPVMSHSIAIGDDEPNTMSPLKSVQGGLHNQGDAQEEAPQQKK